MPLMTTPAPQTAAAPYAAASAISGHYDTRTAALEIAERLESTMGSHCDLLLVFASYHHRAAFADATASIRETIQPQVTLGVTAEAVLGEDQELDGGAGLSAIALRLGDATLHAWTTSPEDPIPLREPEKIRERIGFGEDFRTAIMLADPFSTPHTRLLPALSTCGDGSPVPIVGGLASGATQPNVNVLLLNDREMNAGAVGVSISGNINIDFIVSQGCRPIGKPLVVTKVQENIIHELGGRPALTALKEIAEQLPDEQKELLRHGLLVGAVIDEYRERFGRGDFLVRNVLGVDANTGNIAVADMPRTGQTVQFHVRDAATAAEDLQLLLDAQQLDIPPFAAMLFSCNGRGQRLFGESGHDLRMIRQRLGNLPVAGFFAIGEIGPIANRSFVHGHTASIALFRAGVRRRAAGNAEQT
jgi:small ligand-binding sensory domain FIST